MTETCSCTASLEITNVDNWSPEVLFEAFATWRASHIHEMPPAPVEMPMIHESGSSHERAVDEYPIQDRAPFGFTRA